MNKGITLIAAVIAIIVLLILAGISIRLVANGELITKAEQASSQTIEQFLNEQIEFALVSKQIDLINGDVSTLEDDLKNIDGVQQVTVSDNKIEIKFNNEDYSFQISQFYGEINSLETLKGKVTVGQYIAYPVEYDDEYTNQHYTMQNGWRVIDDGTMAGTSGKIRITSTGIPILWTYDPEEVDSAQEALEDLQTNFLTTSFKSNKVGVMVKGQTFWKSEYANTITILSLADLNYAYNNLYHTDRTIDSVSSLKEDDDLFYIKDLNTSYWLNTPKDDEDLYYVYDGKIYYDSDAKLGIRPVIELKDNLKGTFDSNYWQIVD